jgi:hypothetical protein
MLFRVCLADQTIKNLARICHGTEEEVMLEQLAVKVEAIARGQERKPHGWGAIVNWLARLREQLNLDIPEPETVTAASKLATPEEIAEMRASAAEFAKKKLVTPAPGIQALKRRASGA